MGLPIDRMAFTSKLLFSELLRNKIFRRLRPTYNMQHAMAEAKECLQRKAVNQFQFYVPDNRSACSIANPVCQPILLVR